MNETSTRPPRPDLFDDGLLADRLFPAEPGDPTAGSQDGSPRGPGEPGDPVGGRHSSAPRAAGRPGGLGLLGERGDLVEGLRSGAARGASERGGAGLSGGPGDPVEGPHGKAPRGAGLLLVAHGTRDPAGAAVTEAVAEQVRELSGVQVEPCYVDVRHPTPAEALARMPGPVVAVPMFLAAGYHVRVDVPAQLAATGRYDVTLAETFGPDPALVAAAAARLRGAGMRDGDAVVLAVAGSSDPFAQADGATAAKRLARVLRAPVTLATIAAGGPRVGEAVAQLRAEGASRVAIASWLLAPGLFRRSLAGSGADVVAEPLATHGAVAGLVIARYTAVLSRRSSFA